MRFGAAGAAAAGHEGQRVDDRARPTASPPTCRCRRRSTHLAEHGYRHLPVVEDGTLVGIVSLRDLMRVAQIQPVVHPSTIEAPPGLEGVIVAETVGRRRARPRGLLPLPPVQRRRAGRQAAASRTCGTCSSRATCRRAAERQAFLDEVRPLRERARRRSPTLLPGASPASSQSVMEGVRSAVSMVGAAEGFKPDARHRPRRAPRATRCSCAR